jgi:hypothetical protein
MLKWRQGAGERADRCRLYDIVTAVTVKLRASK